MSVNDEDDDFDFDSIKDDQNPLFQTTKIFSERIISILRRTSEKIRICYCLDELLDDQGIHIKHILGDYDLQQVLEMRELAYLAIYQQDKIKVNKLRIKSLKQNSKILFPDKNSKTIAPEKGEVYYSNMMTILNRYPKIHQMVTISISKKPIKTIDFYLLMVDLVNYTMRLFNTSATNAQDYQKTLSSAWTQNLKYRLKIDELNASYEAKMQDSLLKLKDKQSTVEEQETKKMSMKTKCQEILVKIINDSESKMLTVIGENEETMVLLSDEAKRITQQYDTLLQTHLNAEKQLRVKRYKVETQLANWISKYDSEIGELNTEYETIKNGFDKEKEEFDELKRLHNEQEDQYVVLMEEKALEDRLEWEKRYYLFMQKRSARRIQRWWRHILSKRKGRRRGKKK